MAIREKTIYVCLIDCVFILFASLIIRVLLFVLYIPSFRTRVLRLPRETTFSSTIGCYRRTSRLSHDYRDYRMAFATIAWLSQLSHGYRAH